MGTIEFEQVFLKWNNFENNLASGFADLLHEEAMVDVTLAVDGNLVQAHKIVLSICSSYFRNMFQMNPCQHPIIILKDVGYQELTDMLDFMYKGEVSVKQQNLTSFLRLAETLKVKGLVDNCSEMPSEPRCEPGRSLQNELNTSHIRRFTNRMDGVEDVAVKEAKIVIRKKRKRSISPLKGVDAKAKFRSNKYEAVDACSDNFDGKYSCSNDIGYIAVKEERLSDVSCESYREDIAENVTPENRLLPGSSIVEETPESLPRGISKKARKRLSFIWSFFNFDCIKNKSECKLCGRVFKACPKTGTASVKYHLHFAHQILNADGVIQ